MHCDPSCLRLPLEIRPDFDCPLLRETLFAWRFPPVRRALISDIHGNLEALEVVLDDIKSQGITEIYCLGDIIGYGPNPRECIDLVMDHCKMTLLGNHDQG